MHWQDVALTYPNAQVEAFDISDNFPTKVVPPNVTFRVASALERFPFEDNTFDIVNQR